MTDWNHSIDEAPRGKMTESEYTVMSNGKETSRKMEAFVPDWIWAASKCGKVIKTHWIPAEGRRAGRWLSFGLGERPVAWQPYAIPSHPDALKSIPEANGEAA